MIVLLGRPADQSGNIVLWVTGHQSAMLDGNGAAVADEGEVATWQNLTGSSDVVFSAGVRPTRETDELPELPFIEMVTGDNGAVSIPVSSDIVYGLMIVLRESGDNPAPETVFQIGNLKVEV